jgi:hypothetical protein
MSRAITEVTSNLSPDEAKAQLGAMTAASRRETPAADKLASMLKDGAFMRSIDRGGEHGSSETIALPGGAAFDKLQQAIGDARAEAGDPVSLAMAGVLGDVNESGYLQKKQTVDVLRAEGIGDAAIRQLIGNEPVSRAEYQRVKQWKSEAMESPQFVDAYLKGSPPEVRMMNNANIVLVSPIKDDAA